MVHLDRDGIAKQMVPRRTSFCGSRNKKGARGLPCPQHGYLLRNCKPRRFYGDSESPRYTLLIHPDDRRFFKLGGPLPEFAGSGAKRDAVRLREIRGWPFSLGGGVTRGGEDILFLRHGRISCVCRMTCKLVNLRFIADKGRATEVLGKCRAGGK